MDNVHPPLLADVTINGQTRKAIYYGSKSAHLFVLDRATGKPLLKAEETPVTQDSRQNELPDAAVPEPAAADVSRLAGARSEEHAG